MSEPVIIILIISIYILGCVIYCILCHNEIGTTEVSSEWWGLAEHSVDAMDIVLKSFFWPFMFCVVLILSPVLIGSCLLSKYHEMKIKVCGNCCLAREDSGRIICRDKQSRWYGREMSKKAHACELFKERL